ncbi:P-loop containing nucleoside triphosphate hydrolase protein, partial [Coprinellus micaceus]
MNTNDNMVISAPTGSGKTVLFELAIIRMHMQGGGKCVYIAPTKALCTEKHNDWSEKFEPLGMKCYELTGDTETVGRSLWSEARNASIIITTGEKWDSVTRGWNDHQELLGLVRLFLVDEVHVLGESRGSTLEVVVSRMKMRSTSLRFVLVSATIPNIDDIAAWITAHGPGTRAKVFQFGEEYRPCKLARHVVGVKRHPDMNSFMFARSLNAQLFEVIQTYSAGKPILIFDSTRKGVFSTAELLLKQYTELESRRTKLPWTRPPRQAPTKSACDSRSPKPLWLLAYLGSKPFGIGVHHAGLDSEDRRSMEKLYIQRTLRVLVATSTLAVGVNLPAHFVIIKGVHLWQNGAECEYSDLDIMQMLGRAGRPQFDTEGIAVIMCENNLVPKYQALTHGKRVLESCLHRNLSEHINSEIGMGTITDLESAKSWLRGSFFYQRVRKNPSHYAIEEDGQSLSWQGRMDNLVLASIQNLRENHLVEEKQDNLTSQLVSTEYGEIMSKFYIRQATMAQIIAAPNNATLRDLMEVMSRSEECASSGPPRTQHILIALGSWRISYAIRRRGNPEIRFEIKKVETTADKILVLTQAVLGGVSLNDPVYKANDCQLYMEVFSIFKHANRLCRAIVEVGIVKKNGSLVKHGLELVRCLTAKAWEDRPVVLRQIEALGEKSIKVLAEHGATTIDKLRTMNPMRIEALLKRAPPFGHKVVGLAEAMPRYCVSLQEIDVHLGGGKQPVEVEISITCALANPQQYGVKPSDYKGKSRRTYDMTSVLTISSDYDFVDYRRIQTKVFKNGPKEFKVSAQLTKPSQSVLVIVSSDTHAGCTTQAEYKPKIQPSQFPVPDTRPITSTELDLAGLEDDPDFWKMSLDSSDDVRLAKQEPVPTTVRKDSKNRTEQESVKKDDPSPPPPRKMPNGNYECN